MYPVSYTHLDVYKRQVVMISLGIGLNKFTMEQYESSGSLTAIRVYNYDRGNTNDKTNPEDGFMTDETMKVFERIPHVVSAYPKLNMFVIMKQGVYEGNIQLIGVPRASMKEDVYKRQGCSSPSSGYNLPH